MKMFYQTKLAPICAAVIMVALPSIASAQNLAKEIIVVPPGQNQVTIVAQNTYNNDYRSERHNRQPREDSRSIYERELAACDHSGQERSACVKEAGAALDLRRRGELTNDNRDFVNNAVQRCGHLPVQDQADCQGRILGEGKVSGSVSGGGLLREITTTTIVEPNGSVYQIKN